VKTLLLAISVGATMFFLIRGGQLWAWHRSLSRIDLRRAALAEEQAAQDKVGLRVRLRASVRRNGYEGDLFPFAAAMSFLYLLGVVVAVMAGASYLIAGVAGFPIAAGVAVMAARVMAQQRRRKFNKQLVDLLELLTGQIESGNGAQKALQTVVPSMQEPLQSEMSKVLDAQLATKDLVVSMRELGKKYPSRAMSMFIAALEIDQAEGHAIAPALRQAATMLKSDFALAAEATAEISQTRGEFFIVFGIMVAIGLGMIFTGDPSTQSAYTSPMGIAVISLGLANVGLGVWRFLRILNNIRGDS